ncbi:MAG: TatD family hydrolase [Candidatus Omnitrophota bacterium]
MIIDSHCHITSLPAAIREKVLEALKGRFCLIDSSIDLESCAASLKLSENNRFVYSSLGFHPFSAEKFNNDTISVYEKLIESSPKVVSIGEVGLDFKAGASLKQQEEILEAFIRLAVKLNLPLVIHNRLGSRHILDILKGFYDSFEKVVFHCFSYPLEFLEKIIEKNGYVSFSLNILRGNEELLASLKACPVKNMLLETDSPYMRIGKRTSTPDDITEVYSFASEVKGIGLTELEDEVFSNAKKVYKFHNLI